MDCKDCKLLKKDTKECKISPKKRKIHDISRYPSWCPLVANMLLDIERVK